VSAVASGKREEASASAALGQPGQLVDVDDSLHVTGQVALAKVEEQALDQQVDELLEQALLEEVVTLHQLDRGEDVVLLLSDPLPKSIVGIHVYLVHHRTPRLLLVLLVLLRPSRGYDHPTLQGGSMAVSAYILIQTEVGKAAQVAVEVDSIDGVVSAEDVTGPYDVIARAEATTVDELGKMVVSRVQMIDGITRTLTCPVVHL
jgi:DNA-binding Lrp family transcriptional regulator